MTETLLQDIIPQNDAERLAALYRYRILDTPPEESFNEFVRLIAETFHVPIALISFVDKDRVYFKGNFGMPGVQETDRNVSLCSFAILSEEPTVFEKPLEEPCLLANPLVHGQFGLRFYAAAPLITKDGFPIGSVCIVDKKDRTFPETGKTQLERFARLIMHQVELRMAVQGQAEVEQQLKKANEELRFVTDTMPQMVWATEANGHAYFFNRGWTEYTGLAAEELQGNGWTRTLHPDDRDRTLEIWNRAVRNSGTYQVEYRVRRHDGAYHWFLTRGTPMKDEGGKILKWYGSTTDIHEQKLSEEAQKRGKERFDLVSKATQDAIWDWNLLTDEIWWNESFKELFGYSDEEIEPTIVSWSGRVHPDDRDRVVNGIHSVIDNGGKNWSAEYRFRKKDGSYAIVFDRGYALHDSEGRPYRMVGSMQDITARKQTEEALKESEARFRQLANSLPIVVWTATPEGSIDFISTQWEELYGNPVAESLGSGWSRFIHPDDAERTRNVWMRALSRTEPYETEFRLAHQTDGYRWVLVRAVPIRDESGTVIGWYGSDTDIEEKKQAEALLESRVKERTGELEEQKTLLDNILTNSSNGISVSEMIRDAQGNVTNARTILANDAAVRFTGLPREVYLSRTACELDPEIFRSPYGRACLQTLQTGTPAFIQYFLEMAGRWLELTISRMDADHLIHIFTDVTPIKEAQLQLERSVEELKRSNANLEEFAYAASHDMKEPIRKIHFFSDLLKGELESQLTPNQSRIFGRLEHAAQRMGNLIDDLLAYSQATRGAADQEDIDLNKKVRMVLGDLELEVEQKGARIKVAPLPHLKGHKRQMQQLLQNLISNALKYARPGTAPEVQITASRVRGKEARPYLPPEEGEKYFHLIEVRDNGIGFEQEDAERIFNMFTRLHGNAEYRGTGVGLSIVRKVVENHNGYVWAKSEPDKGASFFVLLPAE
ncbi:MAG TPA: PAS domain-containing protein [Chitinophagaceae bacterium]|jgi:PAS domain S-box-containing protein|nr:PAS domain-containing protein [Chitinophagaceae bacterium]